MNRRNCINCQASWSSLSDDELEGPHMCPRCGDELAPIEQAEPEATDVLPALAA